MMGGKQLRTFLPGPTSAVLSLPATQPADPELPQYLCPLRTQHRKADPKPGLKESQQKPTEFSGKQDRCTESRNHELKLPGSFHVPRIPPVWGGPAPHQAASICLHKPSLISTPEQDLRASEKRNTQTSSDGWAYFLPTLKSGKQLDEAISVLPAWLWWAVHMHRHRYPTSSQQRCLDLDLPCLETQRESLAEVSQGDKALTRNQLLPDPCPPTHKRGEKLEAPLGSRCESHNNDKIHRDLPPVQTWPGRRRNTKTADTLLSNVCPPLWNVK